MQGTGSHCIVRPGILDLSRKSHLLIRASVSVLWVVVPDATRVEALDAIQRAAAPDESHAEELVGGSVPDVIRAAASISVLVLDESLAGVPASDVSEVRGAVLQDAFQALGAALFGVAPMAPERVLDAFPGVAAARAGFPAVDLVAVAFLDPVVLPELAWLRGGRAPFSSLVRVALPD